MGFMNHTCYVTLPTATCKPGFHGQESNSAGTGAALSSMDAISHTAADCSILPRAAPVLVFLLSLT